MSADRRTDKRKENRAFHEYADMHKNATPYVLLMNPHMLNLSHTWTIRRNRRLLDILEIYHLYIKH